MFIALIKVALFAVIAVVGVAAFALAAVDGLLKRGLARLAQVIRPGFRARHAGFGVLLLVASLALIGVSREAFAAGTGTDSWGQLKVDYYTDGSTVISVRQKGQVFVYAYLTSAQTTELRSIYTSAPAEASGGQTPAGVDGTDTLPACAPHLGDLTD